MMAVTWLAEVEVGPELLARPLLPLVGSPRGMSERKYSMKTGQTGAKYDVKLQ